MLKKVNAFEGYVLKEMTFWNKPYYKLGFINGMTLKNEMMKEKEYGVREDSFFYKYIDSVIQFLEEKRFEIWSKQKEYKAITYKMKKIKNKYPNVRTFIEDREIIELTKEELKALLEYIKLDDDIEKIEKIETFKLGLKEGNLL